LLEAETMPTVQKIAAALRDLKDGRVAVARRASVWRPGKAGASEEMPKAGTPAPVTVAPAPSSSDKADEKSSPSAEAPAGGQPILLPHGDLTVSEATVVRWIKNEGDKVAKGEGVVEVETDKAVLEVESPCDGTIARHTAKLGDVVPMGGELGLVLPQ
jgi:biotin carboxyl carrier protein